MKTLQKHTKLITIISLILSFVLTGCSSTNNEPAVKYGTYFDTYVSISIYGTNNELAEEYLASCFDTFNYYESIFSATIPGSDIYLINNSNGAPVNVNPETIELINKSIEFSTISEGLFDISVYSILQEYDFHEGEEVAPSEDRINSLIQHINYQNIIVDETNSSITLLDPSTQIEIGGIAKGYVADKVAEYLSSKNITGALINIGGDIKTLGQKPNGEKFVIGISDPTDENNTLMGLNISGNMAVTTSGTYARSFYQDGQLIHHILDPKTGKSALTDISSATVITEDATSSDAYTTILILLGSKRAISFTENNPNIECILVTKDGSIIKSSGAEKFIRK